MATTITWTTGLYRYETAGKGFIDQIEYRLKGKDGDIESSEIYGTVTLDRPEDADMEDRSTFATQAKLVAAVKAKLGSDKVATEESSCENAVAVLKAPLHSYASAES